MYWFDPGDHPATVRRVVEHAALIEAVDPSWPIVLSAEGRVMDGMHRVARALLRGEAKIAAVRFPVTPMPDHRACEPGELPYLRRATAVDVASLTYAAGTEQSAALAAVERGEVTVAEIGALGVGWMRLVDRADGCWYLAEVHVDPAHRGRGVGSLLVRTALFDARLAGARLESAPPSLPRDRPTGEQ